MRLFSCPVCGQRLYFENSQCLNCGSAVLFSRGQSGFVAAGEGEQACANAAECGCNWTAEPDGAFCLPCSLNKTIPDLSVAGNRERWAAVEAAKRRVVHSLLGFGLPVAPKADADDEQGLAFDFLADDPTAAGPGGERILTGHDNGLITLNVAEADDPERERMRLAMSEAYRTLLGHFRHELGHYYWDRLVRDDAARLDGFRALFGNETADYAAALERHYADGPPGDWATHHISPYAASHPWEDWAETWAHWLHIMDTLETAEAYRIPLDRIDAAVEEAPGAGDNAFARTLARWLALSEAANQLNRCMGLPDLYPFVITPDVAGKLGFVDDLVRGGRP